jgi:hypothetical protein
MWGRVSRPHGNSGVVKAKFSSNMPAHSFGASARIVGLGFFAVCWDGWAFRLTHKLTVCRCSSLPPSKQALRDGVFTSMRGPLTLDAWDDLRRERRGRWGGMSPGMFFGGLYSEHIYYMLPDGITRNH